ncbi:MAG: TrkA family potassium uptake protein [bacterium]|nr:TrkA family potassium uptake protein [bacterium]
MNDHVIRRAVVAGLGRFGKAVALTLAEFGVDVIAIDSDMRLVEEIKDDVDLALCLEATRPGALAELELERSDVFIVGVGEDFEANVLLTSMALEMGIPQVITRAQNPLRKRVLERVGATRVLYAEQEVGQRLARNLVSGSAIEFINLPEEYSLREVLLPLSFADKTLADLQLRKEHGLTVVAVTRSIEQDGVVEPRVHPVPSADFLLSEGDVLSIIAENNRFELLNKLS